MFVHYTDTHTPQKKKKLCSFREASLASKLCGDELWLLLMRATDWLSREEPHRPLGEVTNFKELGHFCAPRCLLCGQTGLSLPSHHIYNNKLVKMPGGETWQSFTVPSHRTQTTYHLAETPSNHWYNVQCCAMLCFIVLNTALRVRVEIRASHSMHPNYGPHRVSVFRIHYPQLLNPPSADEVLIGAAVALPFSRETERESHICMLSG